MDQDDLWATWKRLTRLLPVWRMPFEWVLSPSMSTLFGVDFVSGLRRNRSSRQLFEVLSAVSLVDLRRIRALADLNHRRQEAVSRWIAITSVTVPASAALTLSELSPTTMQAIAATEEPTGWYTLLGVLAAMVVYYLLCAWRARQLLTLVEMHCIDRSVLGSEAGGADDEPLKEPLGA